MERLVRVRRPPRADQEGPGGLVWPVEPGTGGYPMSVHLEQTEPEPERELMAETDAGLRLLASEAPRLRQAVRGLASGHALVLLRLDRVVVFDAAGIGLLLGLHRLARLNGSGLVLVRPTPQLMTALRRRGLHRVLVVDSSLNDSR